jgi:DNA-directed RNA polymerase specialized sigma24 family protein
VTPEYSLTTASHCDCLICRLEASLIAELRDDRISEEFRLFAASNPILSLFANAFELLRNLHDYQSNGQNPSADEVLLHLLRHGSDAAFQPIWNRLLLLVFIPTVHRTTTQVVATFPLLTRDDTAQHLFAVLLEFLHSQELRSRNSHLAFTVARKLRRSAFRWAIRESRLSVQDENGTSRAEFPDTDARIEKVHSHILLERFLDNCERRKWLSADERELLTQFKLDGISALELARRNGHSAVAIKHRVQRLIGRLRRIAQSSGRRVPEQLNLFPQDRSPERD